MNKSSRVALLTVLFSVSAPMFSTDAPIAAQEVKTDAKVENKEVTTEGKVDNKEVITEKAPEVKTEIKTEDKVEDKKPADDKKTIGYLAKAKALPMGAFTAVFATAPDFVAGYTIKPVLDYIASMKYLNYACFSGNTKEISRAIVLATAAFAAYEAYTMYNAEEVVDTDDFFDAQDTN